MNETKFLIGGTIVSDESQRWAFEDVTPLQVRSAIAKLGEGDGITFEISSPGGDVTAGLAIANLIRAACTAGHPCKAHIVGIAASMASVVACACDEIEIDESAFMMIHNPWTVAQGDADELRKSADVLDKLRDSIMGFYRSKFDKTDDELKALMDAETWFSGAEAETFGFKATVIPNAEPLKAAACARALPIFAKIPETAAGLFVLGKHEETKMNEIKIEAEATAAESAPETPVEATAPEASNEPTVSADDAAASQSGEPATAPVPKEADESNKKPVAEEPAAPEAAAPETVTLAECEKRVSGMQSTMAKQLDQLRAECDAQIAAMRNDRDKQLAELRDTFRADYEAKLAAAEQNFKSQLAAKDEELTKANAEVTRLAETVKKTESELQETASALKAKTDALATLNANVNAPAPAADYKSLMAKAATPEEREALRKRKRNGEFN